MFHKEIIVLKYTNSMDNVYFIQLPLFIFHYSYLYVALCCDDISHFTFISHSIDP